MVFFIKINSILSNNIYVSTVKFSFAWYVQLKNVNQFWYIDIVCVASRCCENFHSTSNEFTSRQNVAKFGFWIVISHTYHLYSNVQISKKKIHLHVGSSMYLVIVHIVSSSSSFILRKRADCKVYFLCSFLIFEQLMISQYCWAKQVAWLT